MSWKASSWAKDQRLGSPAGKSIAMCLGDYADPTGLIKGWASQSELSEAAEVSERTTREWLQRLEDWGLISRERRQRNSGARDVDWIVLHLDRQVTDGAERLRREKTGEASPDDDLPAETAGRTNRQPDAKPTGNETQPTGSQFRAYKEEPPLEPPLPSQNARDARERGEDDPEDRKKAEKAYWRMIRVWPKLDGLPKDGGLKAFLALTPEDRETAERRFAAWHAMLKANGKDYVPGPAKYFGKRLFDDVGDPQPEPEKLVEARPFGKLWQVHRMMLLLAGPTAPEPGFTAFERGMVADGKWSEQALRLEKLAKSGFPAVNALHERARYGQGVTVAPGSEHLADAMEAVRVDGERFAEWQVEHQLRGWPWPEFGNAKWVYFPAGGPARLSDFEDAARGKHHDGDQQAAE